MQLLYRTANLATTGTVHHARDGGLGRNVMPGRITCTGTGNRNLIRVHI